MEQIGHGDQQFLHAISSLKANIEAFCSELQRMLELYQAQLKSMLSNGW